MNLPTAILTVRWMIRDTFRQSLSSKIFWGMLLVSAIAILLCLSLTIHREPKGDGQYYVTPEQAKRLGKELEGEGVTVVGTEASLLFGLLELKDLSGRPLAVRDRSQLVRQIQMILAGMVADKLGVMLALLFTAGFLPTFLEPSSVTVLLAKPVPRWSLLAGKYLGVLAFVFFHAAVFVFGTWAALGLRTGVWNGLYLLALPLLMLHFAIFFSFSTLLAVVTRSTVVAAFGAIGFWMGCWMMNYSHHSHVAMHLEGPLPRRAEVVAGISGLAAAAPTAPAPAGVPWGHLAVLGEREYGTPPRPLFLIEVGYWLFPKPADIGILLFDSLQADNYFSQMLEYRKLRRHGAFHAELSVISSVLVALVILAIAGYEFVTMDY